MTVGTYSMYVHTYVRTGMYVFKNTRMPVYTCERNERMYALMYYIGMIEE
jgi:hypothetical protein